MSWSIFSYTVVPAGAILASLLASGYSLPMKAASKVLSTPVEMGNMKLNIAVIMTAFCGCLSALSACGLTRSHHLAEKARASPLSERALLQDQQMRNVFHQGRNYYLSLLGLALWAMAWRLKVLHDQRQLTSPPAGARQIQRSLGSRVVWVLVGLVALLVADVPLCRLNYNLQLATYVTPRKDRLLQSSAQCENVWETNAGGQCIEFCADARKLSEERYNAMMFVRNWHLGGRVAAQIFDIGRGVEQGQDRTDGLFQAKTCVQVVRSVDKSNQIVNAICVVSAGVAITAAFAALSQVFDADAPDGHHHND